MIYKLLRQFKPAADFGVQNACGMYRASYMLARVKHPSTALYAVQSCENTGIQQERTCFRFIRIPQTELLKFLIAQD